MKVNFEKKLLFILAISLGLFLYCYGLKITGPFIFGDELSYFAFSKSIFNRENLSVHTQYGPLYPALISPFFLFKNIVTTYHGMRTLNIILFLSSVIPIYLLANKLFENRWLKFLLPFCVLISPFSGLVHLIWAEPLYIALLYWTLYFFFLHIKSLKLSNSILLGLFLSLLYYTKPPAGLIVQIAAFLCLLLIFLQNKKEKRPRNTCILSLYAIFISMLIDLPWMLHYQHLNLPIIGYAYATHELSSAITEQGYPLFIIHLIQSFFVQLSYFFIGTAGFIAIMIPLAIKNWRHLSKMECYIILFIILSVLGLSALSALGLTGNHELDYRMVQGRYYSLWLPLIIVLTLHVFFKQELSKATIKWLMVSILFFMSIAIVTSPLYTRNALAFNSMPDLSGIIYIIDNGSMKSRPFIETPTLLLRIIAPLFYASFTLALIYFQKKVKSIAVFVTLIALGFCFFTFAEQHYIVKCGRTQSPINSMYINLINKKIPLDTVIFDKHIPIQSFISLFWYGKLSTLNTFEEAKKQPDVKIFVSEDYEYIMT